MVQVKKGSSYELPEEVVAKMAAQDAEIARLTAKAAAKGGVEFRVSNRKALSLYGVGRFPTTLYAEQWLEALPTITGHPLDGSTALEQFIEEHRPELSWRGEAT